jgi:hypothetical protein
MAPGITLPLTLHGHDATMAVELSVTAAVIAGWTGRDVAKMEEQRPSSTASPPRA